MTAAHRIAEVERVTSSSLGYRIGTIAFVRHPAARGLWVRTHYCTTVVVCPTCCAPPGEPCRGPRGPGSWTHYTRRQAVRPGPYLRCTPEDADAIRIARQASGLEVSK